MTSDIAVSAEDLTKFYGTHRGIEALTLDVRAGEVMGFLGPNGKGKTTTIRLLLDFLRPTRGRASVLGLDPRRDKAAVHRQIGAITHRRRRELRRVAGNGRCQPELDLQMTNVQAMS